MIHCCHTDILCVSFYQVVLFLSLLTDWRPLTILNTKIYLTDVCFVRWTLSGHRVKHRMVETLKGEVKAEDNTFPLYGSRRERSGWEFSNTTGFQQNTSDLTERPDSFNRNVLPRSIFSSDLLPESRQDATEIYLLLCWLSWRACYTCHMNHLNQRLHDFWAPWPTKSQAALPSCATCPHYPLGKTEGPVCAQVVTVQRLHSFRAHKSWP